MLFRSRVFLPWPPRARDGSVVEPEFTLEVVRDPTGCNTHPVYGLKSPTPTVSVYRRPRQAANLKYITAADFGVAPFSLKDSRPVARDPATGKLVNMNMMADAREPTLTTQAVSAALTHLEMPKPPSAKVLERIVAGRLNKQIADDLGISIKTVEAHRANIMEKLNANTVADLLKIALGQATKA